MALLLKLIISVHKNYTVSRYPELCNKIDTRELIPLVPSNSTA